jgi:hypothetical protein
VPANEPIELTTASAFRPPKKAGQPERYTSFLSVIIKVGGWLTLQIGVPTSTLLCADLSESFG